MVSVVAVQALAVLGRSAAFVDRLTIPVTVATSVAALLARMHEASEAEERGAKREEAASPLASCIAHIERHARRKSKAVRE